MPVMPSHVQEWTLFCRSQNGQSTICNEIKIFLMLLGYSITEFKCTCKIAVNVLEPVIFNNVNCSAMFSTMLSVSAYCNQRIHYLT